MKCPQCWAEKAYLREMKGWRGFLLTCLLLRPLQCRHCFHKFTVFWLTTLGKEIHRPKPRQTSPELPSQPSYAARQCCDKGTVTLESGAVVSGPHRPISPNHTACNAPKAERAK